MSTTAYYHPRNIDVDLADLPRWLYDEIASLHGHIAPPPAEPVLTCLGNRQPMYVYRHESGRYFARHYPNGNSDGHRHLIATMSDEHRRQAEYSRRAAQESGLSACMEKSTGNGTRLDVAIYGEANVGFEIQRSTLSRAKAKSRTTKSFDAGWCTAWITDREKDPDWADHVPTGRLTTRGVWGESVPARNTAWVTIADFGRERDRAKRSGWRYVRKPRAVLLDELAYLMPAGEIVPLSIGTKGAVALAFSRARDVIDSCTYPGASAWRPVASTPRQKESAQRISKDCAHVETPQVADSPQHVSEWHGETAPGRCDCGNSLLSIEAARSGRCKPCRDRSHR